MTPKWEKDFNAQFTKNNGVIVEKSSGLQITNKEYIRRYREARNNYQTNKGFWSSPQNRNKGVNEKHWWKSPWIINQMLNSDIVDPNNPNRYLTIHQLKKLERKQRIEELEIGIAQAKMETWNERSYQKGGVNEKHFIGKDGHIFIYDANGKRHKTYPNDALGHYNKTIAARKKGGDYIIGAEEAKVRTNNNQSPNPNPNQDLPKTVKEYSSRAERNQNNQSLKINNKVEVQEENGSKTDYTAKYKQIGNLMINPGGLVGRNADVRRSDGRSTTLSIAQADFGRIKKGQRLGVMSTRERELYDRDVLGIG
jgi:hypothetical protein